MVKWPEQKLAVIDIKQASPIAYINAFENGDIWMKVQGCEACQMPTPQRCCGKCPFATENGCSWQIEAFAKNTIPEKPFGCIVMPEIQNKRTEKCTLIYKCVSGSMEGKYRCVWDHSNIFRDSLE
jgi:hypothetical protein